MLTAPALYAQATLTVDTATDELNTNGDCSLREAITNANDDATTFSDCPPSGSYGDDTIVFDATSTNGTPTVLDIGSSKEDADGDLDVTDTSGLTITVNVVNRLDFGEKSEMEITPGDASTSLVRFNYLREKKDVKSKARPGF